MCEGAIIDARIDTLVYALRDPKAGAAGSVYDLVRSPWLNHQVRVIGGVLEKDVQHLMQAFFEHLRGDGPRQVD